MVEMTGVRLRKLREIYGTIAAAVVVAAAVVASVYGYERASLRAERNRTRTKAATKHDPAWFANQSRGVVRPTTLAAGASGMRDDEEVIGVVVGGKARAYRLDAFRDRTRHLVNDLIGGVPVAVTYCDLSDCVRVYTDPRGASPMDIEVAGLTDGEMVMKLGGVLYFQKSGKPMKPGEGSAALPFELLSPTRTTWKEWVRGHPETDVYVGPRQDEGK
jgi:hypothetical protein